MTTFQINRAGQGRKLKSQTIRLREEIIKRFKSRTLWLTTRQRAVLQAWITAGNMKGAATELGLSLKTVEYHLGVIKRTNRIDSLVHLQMLFVKRKTCCV